MPVKLNADLALLQLLHLADSALPIGGMAHSFGLETLAAEGILSTAVLENFLRAHLEEAGTLEAVFCRAAFHLEKSGGNLDCDRRLEINRRLSALKLAQESRDGSTALGEHFLQLVLRLDDFPVLREALEAARAVRCRVHHSPAFGLTGGVLAWDEESVVQAFLHHVIAGLVSACQRLLPLGQTAAARILWNLKPAIVEASTRSRGVEIEDAACFTPLPDWGAFAHPGLTTRLFVS
jgi:urease accessory protein